MKDRSPSDSLAREWTALAADAARLDDSRFLKIYHLLEQVGDKAPVQGALDTLRPRLAALRPPRRPSLSRLFFRPVEDLLDDPQTYARRLNRIARSTLAPCWRTARERMDPALLAEIQRELGRTDPRDLRAFVALGEPLWMSGALAVREVVRACHEGLKFKVDNFGRDDDVLRQLDAIAGFLDVGREIETLKLTLPEKPIGELAESHVEAIKEALADLGAVDPGRTTPLLLVLTSRMKRPGDLLKMLGDVKLGGTAAEKEGLARDLSGYVVGNLLRQTSDIERAKPGVEQAADLAKAAERLTEGLNSVNDTLAGLRDKELNGRVAAARTEIANLVVRNVVAEIDQTLVDTLFAGATDGGPPDAQVRQAEELAMALRRSARLAPHLGIQREVNAKIGDVRRRLETETEGLLRGGRSAADDPEVQRQVFNSLRMIEILAGSDEAERLYREWKRRLG